MQCAKRFGRTDNLNSAKVKATIWTMTTRYMNIKLAVSRSELKRTRFAFIIVTCQTMNCYFIYNASGICVNVTKARIKNI